LVTGLSIERAASAANAITAIRVAHLDVYWAKLAYRDPSVQRAEVHLNQAWSDLRDKKYERSISAAHAALRDIRGIKDSPPSLYSQTRDKPAGETGG
jgi:hypothetical protein